MVYGISDRCSPIQSMLFTYSWDPVFILFFLKWWPVISGDNSEDVFNILCVNVLL